jgi:hypothetical protein
VKRLGTAKSSREFLHQTQVYGGGTLPKGYVFENGELRQTNIGGTEVHSAATSKGVSPRLGAIVIRRLGQVDAAFRFFLKLRFWHLPLRQVVHA